MKPTGRLELTWTNKDLRLLSHGADTYEWVEPTDWRVTEVRPLRHVETIGEAGSGNLLVEGDAAHTLDALLRVPELAAKYRGKVKLCYIDPPFNTGQAFTHYNDAVEHSVWLTMLRDRLTQIRDLLRPDGSVWVHLDDAEAHRARCVLDEVFGADNFRNAVAWRRTTSKSSAQRGLGTMHETIFFYARSQSTVPNRILLPYTDAYVAAKYATSDDRGPYQLGDLTAPGIRTGSSGAPWRGMDPTAKRRHWVAPNPNGILDQLAKTASSQEKLELLLESRYIRLPAKAGQWPRFKRYLNDEGGVSLGDLWSDISVLNSQEVERLGFDTQKPERLLRRILEIGTNPGDIVLDCYAGSGTTAAVAHKMGRRWVTSEVLPANLATYTRPRLSNVVSGHDLGGITSDTTVEFVGDLPDGVAPEAVKRTANSLGDLLEYGTFKELPKPRRTERNGPLAQVVALLEEHPDVRKALVDKMAQQMRTAAKTQTIKVKSWKGGGGFDVVRVAPSMFAADDGHLYLADWATGGALAEAVAAQVNYPLEAAGPFAARRGRSRLAVLDGMLTCGVADFLIEHLAENETLLVIAQTLEPGVDEHLRKARPGSRARKMPRDLARPSALSGQVVRIRTTPTKAAGEAENVENEETAQ